MTGNACVLTKDYPRYWCSILRESNQPTDDPIVIVAGPTSWSMKFNIAGACLVNEKKFILVNPGISGVFLKKGPGTPMGVVSLNLNLTCSRLQCELEPIDAKDY